MQAATVPDGKFAMLDGKIAIVTGAGAGLGRAEALALAAAGAIVVINDVSEAASAVVDEIEQSGGKAVLVTGDIGARETADALVRVATELGGLHIVVNNAGFVRDRMLFGMSDEDFDAVVRVHLRGHFLLSRNAGVYWREQSKAADAPVYARVINTASESSLFGTPGQPNYASAKAGITALTVATARGMGKYGVRANVIAPRARTAMTAGAYGTDVPAGGVDPLSVDHVAGFVAFLASPAAEHINGQLFVVHGGNVALMAPPSIEHRFGAAGDVWTPEELATQVGGYFDGRDPDKIFSAAELKSF